MVTPLLDSVENINFVDKSGMLNFCVDATKHYSEAVTLARAPPDYRRRIPAGYG